MHKAKKLKIFEKKKIEKLGVETAAKIRVSRG